MKKLYRSKTNSVFTGLLGGAGEYTGVDPVVLRVLFVVLVVFTGFVPGVLVYFLALLIVPKGDKSE